MTAVVITGGRFPEKARVAGVLGAADLVIAVDSGLDAALAYGVTPRIVAGDFDSVSDRSVISLFPQAEVLEFPTDKDETDTEIGIRLARERGASRVSVIGGGGGRTDHLLAIVWLFERDPPPECWISDSAVVRSVSSEVTMHGKPGEVVSFLPLGCTPCRMRSSGLRWPLDRVTWTRGDVGVSNEFAVATATVSMISGRLLLIRGLEALDADA